MLIWRYLSVFREGKNSQKVKFTLAEEEQIIEFIKTIWYNFALIFVKNLCFDRLADKRECSLNMVSLSSK